MNQYRGTEKDIHVRIYRFIIGCFRDVVKKIPKSTENIPIIGQLSSSLTSMGANDQEADAAGSKKKQRKLSIGFLLQKMQSCL